MARLVLAPVERGVFLDQLVEGGGEADIVLAVACRNRQRRIAGRQFDQPRRGVGMGVSAKYHSRPGIFGLGDRNDVARLRL